MRLFGTDICMLTTPIFLVNTNWVFPCELFCPKRRLKHLFSDKGGNGFNKPNRLKRDSMRYPEHLPRNIGAAKTSTPRPTFRTPPLPRVAIPNYRKTIPKHVRVVWPKFKWARTPDSRSSADTTEALISQERRTKCATSFGSRPRISSTWVSIHLKNAGSRMTPYLTTSANPDLYMRSDRLSKTGYLKRQPWVDKKPPPGS
jgi:hypothetical protein